jgi:hypothetical protein
MASRIAIAYVISLLAPILAILVIVITNMIPTLNLWLCCCAEVAQEEYQGYVESLGYFEFTRAPSHIACCVAI